MRQTLWGRLLVFAAAAGLMGSAALAGPPAHLRPATAAEMNAALLAGSEGECRRIPRDRFELTDEGWHAEALRPLPAGEVRTDSPGLNERLRTGEAQVAAYIPLCDRDFERVTRTLRAAGVTDRVIDAHAPDELERAARLGLVLELPPDGSTTLGGPLFVTAQELYLSANVSPCGPTEQAHYPGMLCAAVLGGWSWRVRPNPGLEDLIGYTWNRDWLVDTSYAFNQWAEIGCSLVECHVWYVSDHRHYYHESDGTSMVSDISLTHWRNGVDYTVHRWRGTQAFILIKDPLPCPCYNQTLQVVSTLFHQTVAITPTIQFGPTSGIEVTPGLAWERSYDAGDLYTYQDGR